METFDRQYFLSSRRRKYNVSLLADWRIFPIWQLLVPATQDLLGLFHPWSFTVYNTFSPVVQQLHYIELCHFKMVQCVPNKMVLREVFQKKMYILTPRRWIKKILNVITLTLMAVDKEGGGVPGGG